MIYKKPASLALALGFAASLACAPVLAQEESQQLPVEERGLEQIENFEQIDQNGDGQVTKEEFMEQGSEEAFQQADQNGDGVLTPEEFQSAKEEDQQQKQQQQE